MSKRVLVTGGAGFIGSHVVDLLVKEGFDVYVLDDLSSGREENLHKSKNKIAFVQNSILYSGLSAAALDGCKPHYIIHLAAQPSLLKSLEHPQLDAQVNILGTIGLLEGAKKYNSKFIFSSTSCIYDDTVNYMTEMMIKYGQPGSPYGISKLAAEYYINLLCPNSVIFRFANIYGERQVPLGENQLIPRAMRHILHGDPFEVFGDGTDQRDYMYAGDVAKAILRAIESDVRGTFNLSTKRSTQTIKVLEMISKVSGWEGTWAHGERRDGRGVVHMDNEKFKVKFPGFKFTKLETGLKKTWKWAKRQ